jgi:hypothetical protein
MSWTPDKYQYASNCDGWRLNVQRTQVVRDKVRGDSTKGAGRIDDW